MSGVNRLPAGGLLVDRSRTVRFSFEGQSYTGIEGDTIASALAANDRWLLSRSFKYHRPRGLLTLAGQDANTLVQLPDEPNVLADREAIRDGLEVRGQHYEGSLDRDRGAWIARFARFLPVGFYYRAFYKPRGAWHFWERQVRARTGLGRVNLGAPHGYYDKAYAFYDLVVVGAGPAGLAAAVTAARAGAEVLLVDENPALGGSLSYARFEPEGERAALERERLLEDAASVPGLETMTGAVCNGWFADNYLPVIRGNRLYKVRAQEVILAAGAIEQPAVFRNNDLPGIMQGSAAQRLIRLYGVRPGRRGVVLTANADGYGVALDLAEAGVEVAAVVDLREHPPADPLGEAVSSRGIPVLAGHAVYTASGGLGGRHLREVRVCRVEDRGPCRLPGRIIRCDLLCMSPGYLPAYQLACQAGGRLDYDDDAAEFRIRGLPRHLALAGSLDGAHTLDAALASGRRAGFEAARALGLDPGDAPAAPTDPGAAVNDPWPIFRHPRGKEFVDLDEDLQIADIVNACADGYEHIELVKRFSTAGMGPSQGRHSALSTARIVAETTGRSVAETGVTTARPPFAPEKLGVLAGRRFEPERHTPMHALHEHAGAQWVLAGLWLRPGWYGEPAGREACLQAEARNVRDNVGLIDVSTLGGLEVRGPDAGEFLDRLYTSGFARQPVGRARYALMTNQQGAVIDDGVACRFHARHYYVTATTGGVDNVYRSMLRWNAQWRLDVDVANVTNAWAGINIAGPRAREVLSRVCEGVDLSADAFPYMAVRQGRVAGVPARLIRVGFVGEIGYEIHVPSSFGEALWEALLAAGAEDGIRPFGVETQRLLRLEKGHVIIGQDTDSMTHPEEIHMGWAIARRKPFFVGARSIELLRQRPPTRRLVGFTIDDDAARPPEEGNLVVRDGRLTGRVTSCCRSPTLGKTIGMAYVAPDQAEPGTRIAIRGHGTATISAEVAPLPFYDPDNLRQAL